MGLGHQEWSRAGCIKHTEVVVRFRDNPTGRVVVGVVCKHRHVERKHLPTEVSCLLRRMVLGVYSSSSTCFFVLRVPMRGSIFLWLLVTGVMLQFPSKDTSIGLMYPYLHGSAERNLCRVVRVMHS